MVTLEDITPDMVPDDYPLVPWSELPDEVHDRIEYALALFDLGLTIIPLKVRDLSRNQSGKEAHRVLEGFTSRDEITNYLSRWRSVDHPFANYGARAGSGFVWIDLDVGEGKDGIAAFEALAEENGGYPETFTVQSPSGGRHLLFRVPYPVSNEDKDLPAGVNIRGQHGYVVGCGSGIPDYGTYSQVAGDLIDIPMVPDWLLALLHSWRGHQEQEVRQIVMGDRQTGGQPAPYHGVRAALSWIDFSMNEDEGSQDLWLGITKALRFNQWPIFIKDPLSAWYDRIDDGMAMQLCHDAMSGRLWGERIGDPDFEFESYGGYEVLETRVKDGVKRTKTGTKLGTIFELAKANGWPGNFRDKFIPYVVIRQRRQG